MMDIDWPYQIEWKEFVLGFDWLLQVEHKFKQISSDSGIIEITMRITFFICVTTLHSTLLMDLDWPYQNWGKKIHSRFHIDCCKHNIHFKQVNSDSGTIEITMEITVSHLVESLTQNVDGFRFVISKLREKRSF